MKLNFIDLFCGAGGLSHGLEKSGLNCLMGIDFLEPAVETFRKNHINSIGLCADLRELSISEIKKQINKKVHLICGGPPCQGFSTIGTNNAKDNRNHLFMEYVKFVKGFKPNYILIENVTGLLSTKNRDTLISVFNIFEQLGYHLDIRVLSANHYGVPQARRRVIIIGNNQNIENIYPQKISGNSINNINSTNITATVGWAFNNLLKYENNHFNHELSSTNISNEIEKKRIKYIPQGKSIRYERDEKQFLPKELWFEVDWENITEKRFREAKLVRLDSSKPSPTIVTDRKRYYHPEEDRYLTLREAAALQSFPPNFIFYGSLSKQWTQVGNAVPPIMAKEIGKSIIEMHKNRNKKINFNKNRNIDLIRSSAFKYDKENSSDLQNQSQIGFDL